MRKVPPNILDIESTPSSVAVRENQNINMTCRADGFPTPKIIWRREDGQSITVERKKKVMVYDGEVLHLSKLSRNEVRPWSFVIEFGGKFSIALSLSAKSSKA
jgi:neurotrimin